MEHVKFHYQTLAQLKEELEKLQVTLPLSENTEVLRAPLNVQGHVIPNRIAIQPMEGADGIGGRKPSEYMSARYHRFGQSGAGLVWWEATAVVDEARATPGQLTICPETVDELKKMVDDVRETAWKEQHIEPVIIMQATHSGRYSKPHGTPEPIIAYNNPVFEKDRPIDASRIITDDELKTIEEKYYGATKLAMQAGFDGIDVKACHRYINCELFSAYTRPGMYGGSFENRTRFFRNAFGQAKAAAEGNFIVTSRMNIYDGFEYPYGWGVAEGTGLQPDMTEPIRLIRQMQELGLELLNITCGNPYVNPHVNRPYDQGGYIPNEHPLEGEARMYDCTRQVAEACPDLKIIASAPSYLRQFAPNLAAGAVEQGIASMVGFGRMSFAYPGFAAEMLSTGKLDPKKSCITCGKCAELLRACEPAGCVIRNSVYSKIYQERILQKG